MLANVAVCELPDSRHDFPPAWAKLMALVETNSPDVLLLNEAPFDVWFAREPEFDAEQWHDAVENHHRAMATLGGFGCAVIATAPVTLDSGRHNRAFTAEPGKGVSWWRRKAYLPNEEPVYEASWYSAAHDPPDVRTVAGARVGVLTCTEIWRMEWASRPVARGICGGLRATIRSWTTCACPACCSVRWSWRRHHGHHGSYSP